MILLEHFARSDRIFAGCNPGAKDQNRTVRILCQDTGIWNVKHRRRIDKDYVEVTQQALHQLTEAFRMQQIRYLSPAAAGRDHG